MTEQIVMIAVAFPVAEPQRALLRRILGKPLPSMYKAGAEERPCATCGLTLNVGPRLLEHMLARGVKVYCPICLIATGATEAMDIMNLGNPESGWESPYDKDRDQAPPKGKQ
jgi:hypothetical protein